MMKNISRAPMNKKKKSEAGNIFFMLFASIAVIGAMTAGAGNIVKGIVTSMSDVTRKTITEEKMQGGARISIQASTSCDDDDTDGAGPKVDLMEPLPYRDAGTKPHPAGGGYLPEDIGATLKDPWGTEYGYCAWDPGGGTGCGVTYLAGTENPDDTVVAVISAGKDRKFSTSCNPTTGVPEDCTGLGNSFYNDPSTGHCYYMVTSPATWDTARANCAADGAHLVTITSSTEHDAVKSNVAFGGAQTWVGASDIAVEGEWRWVDGPEAGTQFWQGNQLGSAFGGQYAPWVAGIQPDGGPGVNCAWMGGVGWAAMYDNNCVVTRAYTCEKSPVVSSPVTKASGSDDIVMEYSYNDANGMSGNDLWKINDTKPGSAKIDKDIDVGGGASLSGPLNLMKSGLILPGDADTGACDVTTDQQIRINFSMNPPTLEICVADTGTWETVSMGGNVSGLPSGAVSWWKMDETTGTLVEDFVGGNDGAWQPNGNVVSVSGANGTALDANGTHAIDVPDDPSLTLSTYSLSIWVNPDTIPSNAVYTALLFKGTNYAINWDNLYGVPFACTHNQSGGGGWIDAAMTSHTVVPGNWIHIACTYDGTAIKAYVNGQLLSSVPATPPLLSTDGLSLGSYANAQNIFPGAIDDAIIFDRALTATEIEGLYTAHAPDRPAMPSGYVGYWKFDEGVGPTAGDSSGNNITGTIDGAVWATGKNGGALDFDGNDGRVDLGSPALLNIDKDITVGAWVNLRSWGGLSGSGFSALYSNNQLTGNGIAVMFYNGLSTLTDSAMTGPAGMGLNKWQYVTVTTNTAGTVNLYIDGYLHASNTDMMSAYGAPQSVWIGDDVSGMGAVVDGLIDDVVVYNRALDETEAQQLFQSVGGVMSDIPALSENFLTDKTAGQCSSAGQGPFIQTGVSDSAESYDRISNGKNYLFSGGVDSGISAFTRNGDGTVTRITTHDFAGGNFTYNVYTDDDQLVYAANGSNGVTALTFNGTAFTEAATVATPGTAVDVTTHGQYVLVADSTSLIAYRYNAGTFNQVGQYTRTANAVWTDGKFIYLSAGSDGLVVLTFNGSSFEEIASVPAGLTGSGVTYDSTSDGRYIYVNNLNSMDVYEFDGIVVRHRAEYESTNSGIGQFSAIYTDGQNVFLGSGGGTLGKLEAVRFDGTAVVSVGSILIEDNVIWGNISSDGGYIYAGFYGTPMRIFSGFSCNTGNNNFSGFPASGFNSGYGKISTSGHTCAVRPDGSAWCWGAAGNGRLGNGTTTPNQTTPVKVSTDKSFTQIIAGTESTCALDTGGSAWCWGGDSSGQLGNGAVAGNQLLPYPVAGNHKFTMLAGGYVTFCGITTAGDLYCWGDNNEGELGDGTQTNRESPTLVLGGHKWAYATTNAYVTCGIDSAGQMWCWGSNYVGGLGIGVDDGFGTSYTEPQLVADPGPWVRVDTGSANCGIKIDGSLWCWGQNEMGTVGLGLRDGSTWTNKPKRVADRGPWKDVTVDNLSCGIKQDGTAWCWGVESSGGLGNNGVTDTAVVPMQVLDPGPWASITGGDTNCGIKVDGSFWCWGNDDLGAVGNGGGTTGDQYLPNAVVGGWNLPAWSYDDTGLFINAAGTGNISTRASSIIGYKASGPTHDCAVPGATTTYNDVSTGHCYFTTAASTTWDGAQAVCAAAGGYLASITSQAEQNRLTPVFGGIYWIGISDAAAEGSWTYTGGELAGNKFWNGDETGNAQNGFYNNWATNHPGNASAPDDCGRYGSSGNWQDVACTNNLNFICEVGTAWPKGGLSFPTVHDKLLSHYDSSTELAVKAMATNSSSQIAWKAQSAVNTRSMGLDYLTKAFSLELNTTSVNAWLHDATYNSQFFINTDGRIGLGLAQGALYNKLTIGGGLKVGNDTSNCHAMRAGTLRYVGGGKPYKYCNGSAWVDF